MTNTHEIQFAPSSIEACKVLVAEDNIMNQKYIISLLNKWNIDFIIASDGRNAIEQAQKQQFDIILMDIQMPNTDGYEATIAIRNTKNPNQNTPIIALTASAMLDQKNKALAVGINDFMTKPFAPNSLLNIFQSYIQTKKIAPYSFSLALDYERLRELYGNDKNYAADMFQTFLNDVLPDFQEIGSLIKQQNWDKLGILAHKLKPTLAMVGLSNLENQMQQIEKKAKENIETDTLPLTWNEFQKILEKSIPFLKEELQKLTSLV